VNTNVLNDELKRGAVHYILAVVGYRPATESLTAEPAMLRG